MSPERGSINVSTVTNSSTERTEGTVPSHTQPNIISGNRRTYRARGTILILIYANIILDHINGTNGLISPLKSNESYDLNSTPTTTVIDNGFKYFGNCLITTLYCKSN